MRQRGSSRGLLGKIGRHICGGIVNGIVDGVRQPRDPFLDLLPRQRGIAEQNGPAGQRRRAHLNAGGREGIDARLPRAMRLPPPSRRPEYPAADTRRGAALPGRPRPQRRRNCAATCPRDSRGFPCSARAAAVDRGIAAGPDEIGERCLLEPRSAIAEQHFRTAPPRRSVRERPCNRCATRRRGTWRTSRDRWCNRAQAPRWAADVSPHSGCRSRNRPRARSSHIVAPRQ